MTSETLSLRRGLAAVMTTGAISDIAISLVFQLQPIILDADGTPSWQIGMIVAMGPLGILLAGTFIPDLVIRVGLKAVTAIAIATAFGATVLFSLLSPPYWWLPIRFLFGIASGTLSAVSESWLIVLAPAHARGAILAIYSSILSITFGIGAAVVSITGVTGFAPWLAALVFLIAALLSLLGTADKRIQCIHPRGGRVREVLSHEPYIFACAIAATFFDAILISFFTIYATRNGIPVEEAAVMLGSALFFGGVLSYPLGVAADRWSASGMIALSLATSILCSALMPIFINTAYIWPLLITLCIAGIGVYVLTLALVGATFKDQDVVAASSAIAMAWGITGVLGPPLAGALMDHLGSKAFPGILAFIYLALLLLLATNSMRVARSEKDIK